MSSWVTTRSGSASSATGTWSSPRRTSAHRPRALHTKYTRDGSGASGVSERICSMSIESLPSDRVEQQT